MAIAWYIVPYEIKEQHGEKYRRVAICNYSKQIRDSGGAWTETEILGDRAIVKVRASDAILSALNTKYKRLPKDRLDDSLSNLPENVKMALKNEILDMGYSIDEIRERFGNDLGQYTLRDVLKFMTKRRLKPRYDSETDTIFVDGIVQKCRSIESVNSEIQ